MNIKEESKTISKSIGVYIIYNNEGNKDYIGSTKNLRRRFLEHFRDLKANKHVNPKLQNYYNKHGKDSLEFCCLCENLESLDLARKEEKYLIDKFDSYKNGFNCTDQVLPGNSIPIEIRKIISDKARERQSKPEVKEQLRIRNSGVRGPTSKLKQENVDEIRTSKLSIKELALKFKVSHKTIKRVLDRKTYII